MHKPYAENLYAFKSKRKLNFYIKNSKNNLNINKQNSTRKYEDSTLKLIDKKVENISNTTPEFNEDIETNKSYNNIFKNETHSKSKISHDSSVQKAPKFLVNDDIINLVHVNNSAKTDKLDKTVLPKKKTRNLDTYAESLLYVNKIYNKAYGLERRRVPAHMPHLLDRTVIEEMQEKFANEFEKTSSHRVRNSEDMQFAFSYFYFLLSEKRSVSAGEIFDMFDTDRSRQVFNFLKIISNLHYFLKS